jgi:carboxymethylenebutenolidase
MELRDYLRDEILEEAEAGYLTAAERDRRLMLFDSARSGSMPSAGGGVRLMTNPATSPSSTVGVTIPESDPAITIHRHSLDSDSRPIECYVARPSADGTAPGILVIHENRGLVPHIRDVARRYAKLGYVALAPDLLTPLGGADSFSDPAEQIAALGSRDRDEMLSDLGAALDELASLDVVRSDRLGVTGFCFGGGMSWRICTRDQRLRAAVPFYGGNPPLEDVPNITAAVLGIYGALDERVNAGIDAIEKAMADAGKVFEKEIYPGAQHAFHNDTNPDRYNPDAAGAAWARATSWFERWLKD